MFEKFTERARRVVFFARYEAKKRRAWAIEPEHLLSGLLREDPELFQLLSPDGEDPVEGIRIAVGAHLAQSDKVRPVEDLPLSPFGKQVIRNAGENSRNMGHAYVGTEHLLLAILKQGHVRERRRFWFPEPAESVSARILRERGFTSQQVAARIEGGSITRQTREPVTPTATVIMVHLSSLIEVLMRKGIFTEQEFLDCLGGNASLPDIAATLNSLVKLLVRLRVIDDSDEYEVLGFRPK